MIRFGFAPKGASAAVALAIAALGLAGCSGADHPAPDRYEYRYMNGRFVAPYAAFPSGRERDGWQCYDGKAKRAHECTFVRGGFEQFQYIYRKRA